MKTFKEFVIASLVLGLAAVPALAVENTAVTAPKSLADFQRAYSGTKPIVAFNKYWESKAQAAYPATTLSSERMRSDETSKLGNGTKPHAKHPSGIYTAWVSPDPAASTKPMDPSIHR